jgi:hypothetical protein
MDIYDSHLRKKAYKKMDSAIKWGNKNSEVKISNMTDGFMNLPEVSKPEFERRVIKSRDVLQHADNRLMSKMLKLDNKIHKAEANLKYKKLAKLKTKRNLMESKLNKYDFRLKPERNIPEDMNYSDNCINFNVIDILYKQ